MDEDFGKLFKVLVDFDQEMDRSPENEYRLLQFANSYIQEQGFLPMDRASACDFVEYASWLTGCQNKLSARWDKLREVIAEAHFWADREREALITARHIKQALEHKEYREGKYQEKLLEQFGRHKILVDVKGQKIGVINGLSVIAIGDRSYGRPNVITVTASAGKEGVVDVEREANLSGRIYQKGIMIITGFLMEKFAQQKPLSLTARICFEQTYHGIDGDSASCAELLALLSSLSGMPLRQYLGITGSLNQKGYVQPVGGVTEKIEGFYQVCAQRGLTGNQGVVIPYQNQEDLMLSPEIVKAVEAGLFHIYGIRHIHEAIELMMGIDQERVYKRVGEKLENYYQAAQAK